MIKSILYSLLTISLLVCFSVKSMNVQDLNKKLIDTVTDNNLTELQKIQILSKLLKQGADINSRFYSREGVRRAANVKTGTVLIEASRKGLKHVVGFLLGQPGININAQNDDGHTALIRTALAENKPEFLEIAKNLLEHNANIYIKSYKGRTILHYAANSNKIDFIELILKEANQKSSKKFYTFINERDEIAEHNALDAAVIHCMDNTCDYKVCKKLVEEGADVSNSISILESFAQYYDYPVIEKILTLLTTFKQEVRKQVVAAEILGQNNIPGLLDIVMSYY